jgi:hypothetical protein
MKNKKKNICEEFEKEVFLFHEGSLHKERMEFIKNHLGLCPSCQAVFSEFREVTAAYKNLPDENVNENRFNYMISEATNSEILPGKYDQKRKSLIEVFGFYRLSFGGAAVIAAVILIIISFLKEPSIEKKLPYELLDWNGDKIENKIEQIEKQIISLKSDEWDIYIVRKNENENWDATLKNIRNQIDELKKTTNNKEL